MGDDEGLTVVPAVANPSLFKDGGVEEALLFVLSAALSCFLAPPLISVAWVGASVYFWNP